MRRGALSIAAPSKRKRRPAGGVLAGALAALTLAGCGSSAQPDAVTFFNERGQKAAQVGSSVRAVEAEVRALSSPPTRQQLAHLVKGAQRANERIDATLRGWVVGEDVEGEELPTIEAQLSEGAGALKNALAALTTYAGNPSAAALAPYTRYLKSAREKWNEAVTQLWHVAMQPDPPTV